MDKLQKLSVNVETGEETLIDLTDEEILVFQAGVEALENEKAQIEAKIKSDEETKQAAIEKLAALGLTTDDLKALGL
jgi:DNA-binding transcriptional regulator YhcF (GntR family)